MVTSDWTGIYSSADAIKTGLDLEMPGPSVFRGDALARDLVSQKLFIADLDERVRKVLFIFKKAQESGIPFDAEEEGVDTPEVRDVSVRSIFASLSIL